jgi:Domain of unknown function (DUF4279)
MVRASLSVLSDRQSPDNLSGLIGLPYDASWVVGDAYPGKGAAAGRRRKKNCWRIFSETTGVDSPDPVSDTVAEVLARASGYESRFRTLARQDCQVELSVYILADRPPAINFSSNVLSAIVDLGAYLDIDLILTE